MAEYDHWDGLLQRSSTPITIARCSFLPRPIAFCQSLLRHLFFLLQQLLPLPSDFPFGDRPIEARLLLPLLAARWVGVGPGPNGAMTNKVWLGVF